LIICRFFFLNNHHRPSLFVGRFFVGIFHAKEVNFLAGVNLRNGESQDSLLKRFRKKVVKSGVLSTVRRKRWFVSKSEQRRMEKKKAIRRIKRRTFTKDGE
jgi:small subunit ribosomal protein S21